MKTAGFAPGGFTTLPHGILQPAMQDPMPLSHHAEIPLREITVRASRSSGPGGQHANVTASRIEASLDVEASSALSDEQKRLITARLGPLVVAIAQDARSQARNRELALERLQRRLTGALTVKRPRRPTRPSKRAVRRRLEAKRRQAERKRDRRRPGED
jgi:ribosome-associated protein